MCVCVFVVISVLTASVLVSPLFICPAVNMLLLLLLLLSSVSYTSSQDRSKDRTFYDFISFSVLCVSAVSLLSPVFNIECLSPCVAAGRRAGSARGGPEEERLVSLRGELQTVVVPCCEL